MYLYEIFLQAIRSSFTRVSAYDQSTFNRVGLAFIKLLSKPQGY